MGVFAEFICSEFVSDLNSSFLFVIFELDNHLQFNLLSLVPLGIFALQRLTSWTRLVN